MGAILFLLCYRKFKLSDYFLTLKQNSKFLKKGALIISVLLFIRITLAFLLPTKPFSSETLYFQFSLPGINEEIAYRGIMLGLLVKVLNNSNNVFLNPSVWVTSILFGMGHGLSLSSDFHIVFKVQPFIRTLIYGLIWGGNYTQEWKHFISSNFS